MAAILNRMMDSTACITFSMDSTKLPEDTTVGLGEIAPAVCYKVTDADGNVVYTDPISVSVVQ